jgi:nucleoside-triphosphatase THEP1
MEKNILITGRPRVGKSTLVMRITDRLRELGHTDIGGFYTLEKRHKDRRVGFDIQTLDGRVGRLAEVGLESPYRLGKYGIDMECFEAVALTALEDAVKKGYMTVIDEIGYMELKSKRFRLLVEQALESPRSLLATVMRSRFDFPDKIKARSDVVLVTVRVENRDRLVGEILDMLL